MKNAIVLTILGILLSVLLFCFTGCRPSVAQPGETVAEGHRRHLRSLSTNQQTMMEDVDALLLFDGPSKLTEKRLLPDGSD
jgi:hypothetical protein